jgi:hypothetical protein
MKKIIIISGMLIGFAQCNTLIAQDDVYDAPKPKEVRIKQTNTQPAKQTEILRQPEQTVPYYDEDNNSSRKQSNIQDNARNSQFEDDRNYSDDNFVSGFGYTDRIRRFHNPSIQFNYGWNNWNNNFYDPWNSFNNNNGWNNWSNYAFTPSWTFGYNNFYNPFCNNTQIIILQPGFNSWYNTGFCSPFNSWNNFGWNSWNNFGFSPYCANTIYNYGYPNYGGYYDSNRKNVVYAPRTYGYGNTNRNGTSNSNSNNTSGWNVNNNNNTNSINNNTNNNTQGSKTTKWSNSNNNNNSQQKPGSWSNPYKNNTTPVNTTTPSNNNNGWNNSNNNSNTTTPRPGDGSGGIKIGTKPK